MRYVFGQCRLDVYPVRQLCLLSLGLHGCCSWLEIATQRYSESIHTEIICLLEEFPEAVALCCTFDCVSVREALAWQALYRSV